MMTPTSRLEAFAQSARDILESALKGMDDETRLAVALSLEDDGDIKFAYSMKTGRLVAVLAPRRGKPRTLFEVS